MVTVKRQKYLDKLAKKEGDKYTQEERLKKVYSCIKQLNDLGLHKDYSEDTSEIHQILENYIKDGDAKSGHIMITGTKRVFHYLLPSHKKNEISTCLKFDKNV